MHHAQVGRGIRIFLKLVCWILFLTKYLRRVSYTTYIMNRIMTFKSLKQRGKQILLYLARSFRLAERTFHFIKGRGLVSPVGWDRSGFISLIVIHQ